MNSQLTEGRSLAQVCEVFLAGGLEIYNKEGSRFLSRHKKEDSDWLRPFDSTPKIGMQPLCTIRRIAAAR